MNIGKTIANRLATISLVILSLLIVAVLVLYYTIARFSLIITVNSKEISTPKVSLSQIYRTHYPFPEPIEEQIYIIEEDSPEIEEIEEEPIMIEEDHDPKTLYISYVHEICESEPDFLNDVPNLEELVTSMIYHESRFIPTVSNGNHIGLMQISTYWHSDRANKLGIDDMWDPYSNIRLGVDILKDLYYNYSGKNIDLAIMMYNMDFSVARKMYKSGQISVYATNVIYTSQNLDEVI